jgi:hypothetical protein
MSAMEATSQQDLQEGAVDQNRQQSKKQGENYNNEKYG